jgi:hypothetical protein
MQDNAGYETPSISDARSTVPGEGDSMDGAHGACTARRNADWLPPEWAGRDGEENVKCWTGRYGKNFCVMDLSCLCPTYSFSFLLLSNSAVKSQRYWDGWLRRLVRESLFLVRSKFVDIIVLTLPTCLV